MAMMQGSNKPKKGDKPMGGPPVEMMSQRFLHHRQGLKDVKSM